MGRCLRKQAWPEARTAARLAMMVPRTDAPNTPPNCTAVACKPPARPESSTGTLPMMASAEATATRPRPMPSPHNDGHSTM